MCGMDLIFSANTVHRTIVTTMLCGMWSCYARSHIACCPHLSLDPVSWSDASRGYGGDVTVIHEMGLSVDQ